MSKIYGLLGRNISYSLSPVMHNAAFKHFGIDAEYKLLDKQEEELGTFFNFITSRSVEYGEYGGMNVTVPYKIRVKDMLDACKSHKVFISEDVRMIGALNTIKFERGKIWAYNTDVKGFYLSLKDDLGVDPAGKNIIICGAGGAGRAIALYLAQEGKDAGLKIKVLDVDKTKLSDIETTAAMFRLSALTAGSPRDITADEMYACDLIVNATPLGTKDADPSPVPLSSINVKAAVYDLVYARKTELISFAEKNGMKAANGLGMLINQAALAFEIWTGTSFKSVKEVMKKALKEKMGGC